MLIGYAQVSIQDQNLDLQLQVVNTEKASCAQRDRPELTAALSYIRKGDTLVV